MLEESSNTVAAYWSNVLKTIEPTVVQIFHHIEAVFVTATKQVIRKFLSRLNVETRYYYFSFRIIFIHLHHIPLRVFVRETARAYAFTVLHADSKHDPRLGQILQRPHAQRRADEPEEIHHDVVRRHQNEILPTHTVW
jgi:hypothetical protein